MYVRHTQCEITLCHKFRAQLIDRVRTAGKRLCKRMSQSSGDVLERNGRLSDNEKSIRVYGYDPEVRRRLFESQSETDRTIMLSNCSVKTAKNGTDLEVFVNNAIPRVN